LPLAAGLSVPSIRLLAPVCYRQFSTAGEAAPDLMDRAT
jgi:hypothetical protein